MKSLSKADVLEWLMSSSILIMRRYVNLDIIIPFDKISLIARKNRGNMKCECLHHQIKNKKTMERVIRNPMSLL